MVDLSTISTRSTCAIYCEGWSPRLMTRSNDHFTSSTVIDVAGGELHAVAQREAPALAVRRARPFGGERGRDVDVFAGLHGDERVVGRRHRHRRGVLGKPRRIERDGVADVDAEHEGVLARLREHAGPASRRQSRRPRRRAIAPAGADRSSQACPSFHSSRDGCCWRDPRVIRRRALLDLRRVSRFEFFGCRQTPWIPFRAPLRSNLEPRHYRTALQAALTIPAEAHPYFDGSRRLARSVATTTFPANPPSRAACLNDASVSGPPGTFQTPCTGAPGGGMRCVSTRCFAPARCAIAPRSEAELWRKKIGGGMPLPWSGPMTGWMVECTMMSAPLASVSTCAEVDDGRGGANVSLPASPPITTLPAGVSTR